MDDETHAVTRGTDHTEGHPGSRLTPQRREILERLGQLSPELAELYQAALRCIDDDSIPVRGRLLAHCARELMIRLPDYMDVPIETKRVQYKNSLDAIAQFWEDETHRRPAGGHPGGDGPGDGGMVVTQQMTLSNELHARIDRLVKEHLDVRITTSNRVTGVLQPPGQSGTPFPSGQLETFVRLWKGLNWWFVGHAHVPMPGKNPLEFGECESRFETLEQILYTRLSPFYGAVEELDDILEEANRPTS